MSLFLTMGREIRTPTMRYIRNIRCAFPDQTPVIAIAALVVGTVQSATTSNGVTAPVKEMPYHGTDSWTWCPFNVHYIQQMETYAKADERCRRAGGSLPRRSLDQIICLVRFFDDSGQPELASHFSGGEKSNIRKHLDELDRIWFLHDNEHKQHVKRTSSDEKRQVACTTPVSSKPGACNFSVIVHYDLLSFVNAQNRCAGNNSRLPFRAAKDEVQCFKDHFPDINLTWFEGRRPDLFETRSGDRCSLSNPSLEKSCPEDLRFICISQRWKPDPSVPQFPIVQETVTSVNDDDKTNKFATIEKEQRSSYEQLDPFDEDKQLPPYNRPVSLRGLDGDSLILPIRGSAQHALDICFNRTESKLKVLDVGHSKEFYLKIVGSIPQDLIKTLSTDQKGQEMILWAMPRRGKNLSICPVVVVNLGRREVKKSVSHCTNYFTILCETRSCPPIREDYPNLSIPWRRTPAGKKSFRFCSSIRADYTGSITKICSPQGYWETSHNVSCIASTRVDGFKHRIFILKNFDRQSQFIRDELAKYDDALDIVFNTREEVAKNLTELISGPEEAENKTKKFMQEVMQTVVNRVTSRKDFSQACQIGREFLMRFGEKLERNQTVSSDKELAPASSNIAFALTKVSFGSTTTSQLEKSAAIPRRLLSEVAGSLVEVSGKFDLSQPSVVMGHIVMDKLSEDAMAPRGSEAFPTRAMVNTPVVEFFITEGSLHKALKFSDSKIRISFKHNRVKKARDQMKCVFYDTENLVYSGYGCQYESERSTSEFTVCVCNHTTSYAALLLPSGTQLSLVQLKFLEYMTVIGMPLSIFSLAICIVIFTFVRQQQQQQHEQRNMIHQNLCISLLLGDVLLLVASYGINKFQDCTLLGALVHLAFLSALCWMGLEGVHIIHVMWIVFVRSNIPTALYYVLGYLTPLAIVAATFWGFEEPYDRTAQLCFLTRENFAIFTFIVPLVVVVCTNLLAISVVFYRMRTVKSARDEDLVRSACKWARGVAVLVPLLGLPWLVGLFMYSQDPYVVVGAAFLFNVFLVLQGPGIFLCQVWFNNKKRDSVARYLGNRGHLAGHIARLFARSKEGQNSSTKSSKVLSKSSNSLRTDLANVTLGSRWSASKHQATSPPDLEN
ncbi:uncharacterized protein LOC111266396 isoform X3 [Varroa jacobsoni]|nr:uncharacterized protein LOC111266396 isoform X3 [Varroa jacobsoni]XP_022699596.1 uncharacterized protein LOC111266396 isoform X3 [Varroa jacobsoni]XP_022699597.1 uncharacterized protein LOC111266396 isoform X3 [Varroa jacobsoni]